MNATSIFRPPPSTLHHNTSPSNSNHYPELFATQSLNHTTQHTHSPRILAVMPISWTAEVDQRASPPAHPSSSRRPSANATLHSSSNLPWTSVESLSALASMMRSLSAWAKVSKPSLSTSLTLHFRLFAHITAVRRFHC